MSRRTAPCPNCQNGQRLPEGLLRWEYGGEGTASVVSMPEWTGALDHAGQVIAWICVSCQRKYDNPTVTALRAAMRQRRSWRSKMRGFRP